MYTVMIVDDSADSCEPLVKFLEASGYTVSCHLDGKVALGAIIAHTPDVLLLDLLMPEMDGPNLLEVIRSYLRLQHLPVVVLTGLIDSPMIDRIQHLKVNAILAKGKAGFEDIRKAIEAAIVTMPG
jgi:CheY-like chemotaxis protein